MKGYEIRFCIYAESEAEARGAQDAIIAFIGDYARQGVAVTGEKIETALTGLKQNPFFYQQVLNYLKR